MTSIAEIKSSYQERNGIVPEKKLNHQANIVRIETILPHPDPETTSLELIRIGDYQVVTRKGQFKVGDLGVYIQPDSVVPQTEPFRFIWGQYVEEAPGFAAGPGLTPERRRRITVRKFRKEWSEGLLLPVSDFPEELGLYGGIDGLFTEGEDVSDRLGITHYDPDVDATGNTTGTSQSAPKMRRPKTLKGWFYFILTRLGFRSAQRNYAQSVKIDVPEYDVKSIKNHAGTIQDGEIVVITEKIHGSNARYTFIDGVMYAGSKTQWKAPNSTCIWRQAIVQNPWIEEWCRAHPGFTLYGEVVPTQGKYNYGLIKGEVGFLFFDVRTPDGEWVSYADLLDFDDPFDLDTAVLDGCMVPTLYVGPYTREILNQLASGPSLVSGATHIREGAVVKPTRERRVPGVGRVLLKLVSNAFLEKDNK